MTVDLTEVPFILIEKGAPERRERLEKFREKYAFCFEEVAGKPGFVLNANKDRVQFARKDLQVMWLLGFSLWKSLEAFAPGLALSIWTRAPFHSVSEQDDKFKDFERDYRERIEAVMTLIAANELTCKAWPPDIPLPQAESREDLTDPQDKAVYDLVMMATSVLFLHELKHVEFDAEDDAGNPRPQRAEEELQCDVWARDWFMSGLADYARKNSHTYQEVCSKRAMALLLVCEYLRLEDEQAGRIINKDYPPLAQRIKALSGAINLPDNDKFWFFSACILIAEMRRKANSLPRFDDMSPKKITESLIDVLAP